VAKLTPKSAVHKHERAMHKGKPLTPMKHGGAAKEKAMRPKMGTKGTGMPTMPRRMAPRAAMKDGGRACMAAGGAAKVRHGVATPSGAPKAPAPSRTKGLI